MSDSTRQIVKKVVIVDARWSHHSPHSGYHHFLDYMPGVATIRYMQRREVDFWETRMKPPHLQVGGKSIRVPLADPVIRGILSGRSWYALDAAVAEARVLTRMRWSARTLYHLTAAEEHYGILGRLGWPRRCKVVATFHQPPERLWWFFKTDRYLRRLDGAIALASNQLDTLSELVGPERVFLVPHGVDTEYWSPGSGPFRVGRNRTILSVGAWRRDFDTMHRVAEALHKRWGEALDFVIITSAQHASRVASWPGARVRVAVDETELRNWYRSAHVTVLPLRDGTVNNAMLESLACGTPVVMSDVGVARDMPAGEGGLVAVPRRDPDAMTRAIVSIVEDSHQGDRSIRARRLVERLDWHYVAQQLIDVYRRLIG